MKIIKYNIIISAKSKEIKREEGGYSGISYK
jgi:hypothetical protein